METIKPIETKYKGYRFRSRTEARWAVFFDKLGVHWDYEPEGYKLPDGTWYLPDFYSKDFAGGGYFEVKHDGKLEAGWFSRLGQLSDGTNQNCFLLTGTPDFKSYWGIKPGGYDGVFKEWLFSEVVFCCWSFVERQFLKVLWCYGGNIPRERFSRKYINAVNASRQARF